MVEVMDSCKKSDPCAIRLILATANALGHDCNQLTASRSTILNRRPDRRREIYERIKDSFQVSFV